MNMEEFFDEDTVEIENMREDYTYGIELSVEDESKIKKLIQ